MIIIFILESYNSIFYFQAGDYTITLKAPNRNKHFRIVSENSMFTIGPQTFDTLDDLVDHYKKHPIYKSEREKLYLGKPFCHPGD